MTSRRTPGPGPRTVGHRSTSRASQRAVLATTFAVVLSAVVIACGSVAPSGPASVPAALGSGASGASAPGSGGPELSFGPLPSGIVLPSIDPDATPRWPGATVLAVIHLTEADAQIQQAGQDLTTATNNQDLKAMWGAADGLAVLIDKLLPEVDRLGLSPDTQEIGKIYQKAFPELSSGAKQLRDSITAGDANGIVAGSQLIAQGLNDYGQVRGFLTDLFQQALLQQRLMTR